MTQPKSFLPNLQFLFYLNLGFVLLYWVGQKVYLGFSCNILWKNPNELFGQPNISPLFFERYLDPFKRKPTHIDVKQHTKVCLFKMNFFGDGFIFNVFTRKIFQLCVLEFNFCGKSVIAQIVLFPINVQAAYTLNSLNNLICVCLSECSSSASVYSEVLPAF